MAHSKRTALIVVALLIVLAAMLGCFDGGGSINFNW